MWHWTGWSNLTQQIAGKMCSGAYTHMWSTLGSFSDDPMGIHWTGIVFGLAFVTSSGHWTTDFLVVQRVLTAKDLRAAKLSSFGRASAPLCAGNSLGWGGCRCASND
jgi:SSS family solute:Na+ symporter